MAAPYDGSLRLAPVIVPESFTLLPHLLRSEADATVAQVRRLGELYPHLGVEAEQWGSGGWLLYAGADCPLSKAVGLAEDTRHLDRLLDQAEDFFTAHGMPATIDCFPDATPRLRAALAARGYAPATTLQLLASVLPVGLGGPWKGPVLAADTDDDETWVATVATGFRGSPASDGPDDLSTMLARSAVRPEVRLFLATLDGVAVGAGALYRDRPVGLLFATAVLPDHRGQGAQRALIHARMVAAMGEGLQWAMAYAAPGSSSERNLRGLGLDPLYRRETLVAARH